jgi:WhiB family redox-sensing transcriptional regulator
MISARWRKRAACIGTPTETFFPFTKAAEPEHRSYTAALEICNVCPVRRQCLDAALEEEAGTPPVGMRGGLTPSERRSLR